MKRIMGYFEMRRPTKLSKAQKDLLAYMGPLYTTLIIDLELYLYWDFGDFDADISGDHDRRRKGGFFPYVWDKCDGEHIVGWYIDLGWNFAEIKATLDRIAKKHVSGENIPPLEVSL